MYDRRAFVPGIDVSLRCQEVFPGQVRVHAKTAMQQMPTIIRILPVQIGEMAVVQVLCEDSIARAFLDFPAVLQRAESLRQRAPAAGQQTALRVCGVFRNDVDDAVYRIGAPYSST